MKKRVPNLTPYQSMALSDFYHAFSQAPYYLTYARIGQLINLSQSTVARHVEKNSPAKLFSITREVTPTTYKKDRNRVNTNGNSVKIK